MPTYRVTDPTTGRTLKLTSKDDSPPTEQELESLFRIEGYTEMSQRSARLAAGRPNMLRALQESTVGDVAMPTEKRFYTERTPIPEKVKLTDIPSPMPLINAIGAGTQVVEGAISSPIVAAQRGLSPFEDAEFYKTIGRAISGEEPTEVGDVFRNLGIDETASATLGLIGFGAIPGMAKGAQQLGIRAARRGVVGATKRTADAATKGIRQGQLELLVRTEPAAAAHAISKGFRFVDIKKSVAQVTDDVMAAVNRVRSASRTLWKGAAAQQDAAMTKHGNKILKMKIVDDATGAVRGVADRTVDQLFKDGTFYIKGTGRRATVKTARVKGAAQLKEIVDDVIKLQKKRGKLTVKEIKRFLKELDNLAGDEDLKGIYAAANSLADDLRKLTNSIPDISNANKSYQAMKLITKGDVEKGLVGVDDLTKVGTTGAEEKATDLFNPGKPHISKALKLLDDAMPADKKFLEVLKDAVAAEIFRTWKPKASVSLIGGGMALGGLVSGRPGTAAAVGSAVVAGSPRLNAVVGKALGIAGKKVRAIKGSPVMRKVADLVGRNVIDPAILRSPRYREELRGQL